MLTALFGDNVGFTTDSIGLPGVQRSFTSFHTAADEAAVSRMYGGIHFPSANEDGLATERALGAYVLQTFSSLDIQPPTITILSPEPGAALKAAITITGTVVDQVTGVDTFQARIDGGNLIDVPFDGDTGAF